MNNKYLMLGIAMLLFISTAFAYTYADLNSTMIKGWYTLDETAAGPGTIANSITVGGTGNGTYDVNVQVNQAGKIGTSFYFNGLDANASLGNNLVQNDSFSISFWFKAVPQLQNPGFTLARALGGAATTSYVFAYYDGSMYYQMYNTAGAAKTCSIPSGIVEGDWHLAIATFNKATGTLHLNIDNGAKGVTTTGWTGNVYTGATPTWIGKDARSLVGTYWKGYVDQVTYYDTALTDLDINKLWNGGSGITFVGPHVNTLDNNITSPLIGTIQTGFMDVNFTITDSNASIATIASSIYLSATAGAKTTLVYTDTNIADGTGITCNAYIPFTTARNCTYRFNSNDYTDGNYYVDINSYTVIDGNLASLGPFRIDNSMDEVPPVVGPTTLNTFALTGQFISGTGNILGGYAYDDPDYKFGASFIKVKTDTNQYNAIATNGLGNIVAAVTNAGLVVTSVNYGIDWNQKANSGLARKGVAISDNNNIIVATSYGGKIDISRDAGYTWTTVDSNRNWGKIAISPTGQYVYAAIENDVYKSTNWGETFTSLGYSPLGLQFGDITVNDLGQLIIITTPGYFLLNSTDGGINLNNATSFVGTWYGLSSNYTSQYSIVTEWGTSKMYTSQNYGQSWSEVPFLYSSVSLQTAMSYTGENVIIPGGNAKIYASQNYGQDFNEYTYTDGVKTWTIATISNSIYSYVTGPQGSIMRQMRDLRGLNTASCQFTPDNGVNWYTADWNSSTTSCTKYGYTVTPGTTYTFNTRIQDLAGNYGYGTATSSYLAATGSAIQFLVTNETQIPQGYVDINLFTLSGGNRTHLTDITTDISGIAYAILDVGTTYGISVYQNGALVLDSNNITITSSTYNILIPSLPPSTQIPDINSISVNWNPGIDYIYNDVVNLVQTIKSVSVSDVNIKIYQYNDWNTSAITQLYSAAGVCNKNCTVTTALAAFTYDYNKPFYVDINLKIDGYTNRYVVTHKYVRPSSATMIPLIDLIRNVRGDFSCSLDTSLPCGISIIISVILTILLIAAIIMMTGYAGPQGLAVIGLAVLGIFTYVGWFYWIAYAVIVLISILFIGKGVIE